MTLNDWLLESGLTNAEFARMVPCHIITVSGWRTHATLPRRNFLRRIMELTGGKVTPNDWLEPMGPVPPGRKPGAAAVRAEIEWAAERLIARRAEAAALASGSVQAFQTEQAAP